mmetsp:Transcript_57672/g.126395  ORF Transcript_57672/g.126395 Transcript_57672/m.126395 type:complete len:297 (+) Transcript_57672:28-918(+)
MSWAQLLVVFSTAATGCGLRTLFLRSTADGSGAAMPVDVAPSGSAAPWAYRAQLDYNMQGFVIIAEAETGCKVVGLPTSSTSIDPGSNISLPLRVVSTEGKPPSTYSVAVARSAGSSTKLASLVMDGAFIVPGFQPDTRSYDVFLDVAQDVLTLRYVVEDNGQAVGVQAGLSRPGRRTAVVGEIQYVEDVLEVAVDVGGRRLVSVEVRAADRSQTGVYLLQVQRSRCPPERKFFDGQSLVCSDVCNSGFFGNMETGRCTPCLPQFCAVCPTGSTCEQCAPGFQFRAERPDFVCCSK